MSSIQKVGKSHMAVLTNRSASVDVQDGLRDKSGVSALSATSFTVAKRKFEIYPWKFNNNTPEFYLDLYRSNGDIMNLVHARTDFLFGAGTGWFKHVISGKDLILEPYIDNATIEYDDASEGDTTIDAAGTYLLETGNAYLNVSIVDKLPIFTAKDSLMLRADTAQRGRVNWWLLAPDWSAAASYPKSILPVLNYNPEKPQTETILQIKKVQTGQFYYGFATWWSAHEWIRLANRVAPFHNKGLDTEYNYTRICRFASKMIEQFGGQTEKEKNDFREEFYKSVDSLLFGGEGQRKVIFDECEVGIDGKMIPWVEFVDIPTKITGKEYTELYQIAVMAFANASGILSGLTGVSDGKMLGGSGSELRVSADYQQLFRTPRERQLLMQPYNKIVKPALKLPKNVYRGFKNIILTPLSESKTGSTQVITK